MLGANAQLPFNPMYQMLNTVVGHGWANIDLTSYVMFRQFGETIEHVLNPKTYHSFQSLSEQIVCRLETGVIVIGLLVIFKMNQMKMLLMKKMIQRMKSLNVFYLKMNLKHKVVMQMFIRDFIILECFKVLDPEEYPLVYNDRRNIIRIWLKLQWAKL